MPAQPPRITPRMAAQLCRITPRLPAQPPRTLASHFPGSRAATVLRVALLACLAILALPNTSVRARSAEDPARVPRGNLHEQVLAIPGNPQHPVTLQVTLYTPDGTGPFPLAVVNHGATHANFTHRGTRERYTLAAYYFLSRGYAVALPMMRGFAGSGGGIEHRGCDLAAVGIANARDILAVIRHLVTRPDIDPSRVVVAGQSFGGWNTLALGTLPGSGVRGLVNFVAAIRSSDCAAQDASMIAAAGYFGHATRLPSIWFYGDNDGTMPDATWRAMFQRYTSAGGEAELVAFGRFMDDSHQLLSHPEGMPLWIPKLDAFLTRIGLPGRLVAPQYLPVPTPPASHYAAIDDVAAVPYLTDRGRTMYRVFLTRPFPRAFLITPSGGVASLYGGLDPLGLGLRACQARFGCEPYAFDDTVVWAGHTAGSDRRTAEPAASRVAERAFTRTVPAGTSVLLDFAYDLQPDCSSQHTPRLRILQAPDHGAVRIARIAAHPGFPVGSPLAACDADRVPGTGLDYTPRTGFKGTDVLAFEITDSHGHRAYRLSLIVH